MIRRSFAGKDDIKHLLMGLILGILVGAFGFYLFGNRFEIKSQGIMGFEIVKVDKWSGKTWKLRQTQYGQYWDEVSDR